MTNELKTLEELIKEEVSKVHLAINTMRAKDTEMAHADYLFLTNHLVKRVGKLTQWEDDFIDSIETQLNKGYTLSKKQVAVLVKTFERLENGGTSGGETR